MEELKNKDEAKARVETELVELRDKLVNLCKFMEAPSFTKIPEMQQKLLRIQRGSMEAYAECLNTRLSIWV